MERQNKQLVILRPCKCGRDILRLGLYSEDFKEFVDSRVTSLHINLGNGMINNGNLPTYIHHGSIAKKETINEWLHEKGLTSCEQQLLFELEVSEDGHCHSYRYIGAIIK